MGVTLTGTHKGCMSFTFGAGQFAQLREQVAAATLGDKYDIYKEWLATDGKTPKEELSKKCKAFYDAAGDAVYNFCTQSDVEGKLTKKQTRELYEILKNKAGNWSLRYLYFQGPDTKDDFIKLLKDCVDNQARLCWE